LEEGVAPEPPPVTPFPVLDPPPVFDPVFPEVLEVPEEVPVVFPGLVGVGAVQQVLEVLRQSFF